MKTLDPIDAYNAINKFLFYGWNFQAANFNHIWMPEFICYVNWNCPVMHMHEKWNFAYDVCPQNPLAEFWKALSKDNRQILVDWIVRNYNDEPGKAE